MTPQASRADAGTGTLVALMLGALALLAVQDAMAKALGEELSIWQFHLIRSVFVIGLVGIWVWARGAGPSMRVTRPGWAVLRGALMYAAFGLFYLSMTTASFSLASAAFFTMPLYITLLGIVFGGERASKARIGALAAGFVGVLLIVRPWADDPAFGLVYALAGAVCYAFAMAMTRLKLSGEGAMGLYGVQCLVYIQISVAAIMALDLVGMDDFIAGGLPFLLTGWTPPGDLWWVLLATAATHLAGSLLLIRAYQSGESGSVAPLEYMYLPMATGIDILCWGTVPGLETLVGMALIAGAGIVIGRSGGQP